jgi:hypothetical protein
MMDEQQDMGASANADRVVVNGAGQAVSALRASVPGAWFAWPVLTVWEEVEVELLCREGIVFRVNAHDFEFWYREARSDSCDDIVAFRIVGMCQAPEDDLHRLCADWQNRHNIIDEQATYGEVQRLAQAIEARRAETGTGSVADESAVPNGDAPHA